MLYCILIYFRFSFGIAISHQQFLLRFSFPNCNRRLMHDRVQRLRTKRTGFACLAMLDCSAVWRKRCTMSERSVLLGDDYTQLPVSSGIRQTEPVFSSKQVDLLVSRTVWLCFLMLLQSLSSIILEQYSDLIVHHPVITFCLTFLVGAGGNASAQSAVLVVRGLATNEVSRANELRILWREVLVGCAMGLVLSGCGFLRVYLFSHDTVASFAIAACLFIIVVVATTVGTMLPLLLQKVGSDPAHAGPTVQVLMDIIGVTVCCIVCTIAFAFGKQWLPFTK